MSRVPTRLEQEIDNVQERLYRFANSKAYDAGVRDAYLEGYLNGLVRAARWVRRDKPEQEKP